MTPIVDLGNGLSLDLSAEPWRSQGCRWAVAANSGGGKSHLVAVLLEELHEIGQPFLVIDPKIGEYRGLAELPGVLVAGRDGHIKIGWDTGWQRQVVDYLLRGAGVVVDISRYPLSDQRVMYTDLLTHLWQRQTALSDDQIRPVFIVIDEAELFAPQKRIQHVPALEVTYQIVRLGRSFGFNLVLITQRPNDLEKDVLSQCNLRLFGFLQTELDFNAVESELNIGQQSVNGKRVPPPPRGLGPTKVRVTERVQHHHVLSLKTGQFYAVYDGKVWKLPPCRLRRTPDLARTPEIKWRQRPLFETNKQAAIDAAYGDNS